MIESISTSTELEPIVFFEESEDFDLLYDETLVGISEQEIITGVVTTIGKDYVTVDIGFKSDCLIPTEEFLNSQGALTANIGDQVEVYVEALEEDDGITSISKTKAEKLPLICVPSQLLT